MCIFEGIMDRFLYVQILEKTLIPFIESTYPAAHRFMQNNDPKHTSVHAANFMTENSVNWWKTPAESPDLNPIENLGHELKEFIRRETNPKTKERGIKAFWGSVTVEKCNKYINRLRKVVPRVIELEGQTTGY